ncbi:TPA: hypothetical protein ACH3X1_011242 [Trebouxia sp. C0004]
MARPKTTTRVVGSAAAAADVELECWGELRRADSPADSRLIAVVRGCSATCHARTRSRSQRCLTCVGLHKSSDLATRDGKTTWEDLELGDIDLRLKWSGLFHRRKRTPGFFMMRLKARFLGGAVRKYGEKGCLDITTRANIQLRGVPLEDAGDIMKTAGCGPYFCTDW